MFRFALASVFLLSLAASSQTARPDLAAPDSTPLPSPTSSHVDAGTTVNCLADEVKREEVSSVATDFPDLPEAPEQFSRNRPDAPGDDTRNVSGTGVAAPIVEQPTNSSLRTIDRQFILLNALSTGALVADVETTIHAVGEETKASELNPLFGVHPTRARLYGITLPLNALSFYLSYHAKKTMPKRRIWEIGPGLSIAAHTTAAINNLIVAGP